MKAHYLGRSLGFLLTLSIFSLFSCSEDRDELVRELAIMSSKEMIESLTKEVKNARITVGIVQNGEMSFVVYGENGKILSNIEYIYPIHSISKAITGHLFARAIHENLITLENINDSIDQYLDLPPKDYYPTIRRLLTHTSGLNEPSSHLMRPKSATFENPWYGITKKMILQEIGGINLENKDYPFNYSNFGIAVAGLVLEKIFNEDYTSLANQYFRDLGLNNTRVDNGSGNLSLYYRWNSGNPYIPAAGMVSTVIDLMKFAQMEMDEAHPYAEYAHRVWAEVSVPGQTVPELDISIDAMGLAWRINFGNNYIWHTGGADTYRTKLTFNTNENIAVVILSNISTRENRTPVAAIASKIIKELH